MRIKTHVLITHINVSRNGRRHSPSASKACRTPSTRTRGRWGSRSWRSSPAAFPSRPTTIAVWRACASASLWDHCPHADLQSPFLIHRPPFCARLQREVPSSGWLSLSSSRSSSRANRPRCPASLAQISKTFASAGTAAAQAIFVSSASPGIHALLVAGRCNLQSWQSGQEPQDKVDTVAAGGTALSGCACVAPTYLIYRRSPCARFISRRPSLATPMDQEGRG